MDRLTAVPQALSIRQPWVDLILRGDKVIEVREWPIQHRGAMLIHASNTIDWKTAELLGYDNAVELPRGGLVAIVDLLDVVELTPASWIATRSQHRVVHPPVRRPVWGAVLGEVIPFPRRIRCSGGPGLFSVHKTVEARARMELAALHLIDHPGLSRRLF